jgi:hypothetical protein
MLAWSGYEDYCFIYTRSIVYIYMRSTILFICGGVSFIVNIMSLTSLWKFFWINNFIMNLLFIIVMLVYSSMIKSMFNQVVVWMTWSGSLLAEIYSHPFIFPGDWLDALLERIGLAAHLHCSFTLSDNYNAWAWCNKLSIQDMVLLHGLIKT